MRSIAFLCVALGMTPVAGAQPPRFSDRPPGQRDRYVHFPIDPKYQEILKNKLEMEHELEPFKDLVRKMLADPKMLIVNKDQIKNMKLEDPKFKKAIEDWLKSDPKLRNSLLEWMQRNQPEKQPGDVGKLQQELKQILGNPSQEPAPIEHAPIEPVRPHEDPLSNLTERAMKQAEHSQFAEWLKESPAWKRAFEDLRGSMIDRDKFKNDHSTLQSKLFAADGIAWRFAEGTLDRLRDAPRPRLDRLGRDLTIPGLGRIPIPDLGPPGAADIHGTSFSSIGTATTWILAALILILILARLVRWPRRAKPIVQVRPDLGPWPIRPDAVTTRAELILAFDYLALWTLGLRVKSWNHHAVASLWRELAPACAKSAEILEGIYEEARYTDVVEIMSDADRNRARQSLLRIAEAL